jgi:putative addiction module component (TIGR02574 family)
MTRQQILDEVRKLPRDERFDVAMDVWSLVEDNALPLSPSLREELDRRFTEDEVDVSPAEEWHVLRERLLKGET